MKLKLAFAFAFLTVSATGASADFIGGRDAYLEGDYRRAYLEFASGASGGDAKSQVGLGLLHTWGLGTQRDLVVAYQWFQVAAMQDGTVNPVVRILAETNRNYLERQMRPNAIQQALEKASVLLMRNADTDDEVWEDIFAAAPAAVSRPTRGLPASDASAAAE